MKKSRIEKCPIPGIDAIGIDIPKTKSPMRIAREQRHKEFLNDLRESGVTNMFGATPYIEEEFGVSKSEAKEILMSWIKNFSTEKPISK